VTANRTCTHLVAGKLESGRQVPFSLGEVLDLREERLEASGQHIRNVLQVERS
jgi:hypothetical protein